MGSHYLFSICFLIIFMYYTNIHKSECTKDRYYQIENEEKNQHLFKTNLKPMPGYIQMVKPEVETYSGDDRCIIVACYDGNVPGVELFWDYYKSYGYTMRKVKFKTVLAGGVESSPTWCRIPAVLDTIKSFPKSRVIYLDIDTMVNPKIWCHLPDNKKYAPILMNSFTRHKNKTIPGKYFVHGAQVQANAFIVTSGEFGRKAVEKWESAFDHEIEFADQGVIHLREKSLCGIPGWIHCYSNPSQQACHCAARTGNDNKLCIEDLFHGRKKGCNVPVIISNDSTDEQYNI